jgi:uncharacterized protein
MIIQKLFANKIIFIFFIFMLLESGNKLNAENKLCNIYIINDKNIKIGLKAEIADTYESKVKGLMYRRELEKNTGMLFVFESESIQNFWMKNTYIPLSIAYISENGIINEIYNMKPLDVSITYPSKKPCLFALEANMYWFRTNNISKGCRIILNGCFGK